MIPAQSTNPSSRSDRWPVWLLARQGKRSPKPAAVPAAPQRDVASKRRRILIIEDNPDAAQTLADYLEITGHDVCVAHTGPQGVEMAAQFVPEVVLCDIGLPGMNGWEVALAIRTAPATAAARLVAITGYSTDEDRDRSSAAGFEAHLTKPINIDALDALLSATS